MDSRSKSGTTRGTPRIDPRDTISEGSFRRGQAFARVGGPVLLGLGGILMLLAMINFGTTGATRLGGMPWFMFLFFLAGPCLLAGFLMTKVGYAGVIARFMGRSVIPAASENLEQFAEQGGGAVESLAESFSRGARAASTSVDAGEGADTIACGACGTLNRRDASFCDACGAALHRTCGACGARVDRDARFCDQCGTALA